MPKKLYEKSEIWFAVAWIIAYVVLASIGDNISADLGIDKLVTLPILIVLSAMLYFFVRKNGLTETYGLCKPRRSAARMLFYMPLLVLLTANLWYGVRLNQSPVETVLYVLSMFCVGFLEEMIFRGLLFQAMARDSVKSAMIVSSVTFGIGHIINLVNGSGTELLPNLLQVVYATAAGFMFVMMYLRSKSLVVCIAAHGLFNALGAFANESATTNEMRVLSAILLTVITGSYAAYLALSMKEKNS